MGSDDSSDRHCRLILAAWLAPVPGQRQSDVRESTETCHAATFVTNVGTGWKSLVC